MIFTYIETISDRLTDAISTAAVSPQVSVLQSVLLGYLTLWVMAKGFLILAGKIDDPLKDLLYNAAIKAIVISVVFSPTWINGVSDAINGLHEWAGGDVSLYARLDDMFEQVINMGSIMEDRDGNFEFTGFFCQIAVIIAFAIVSIPAIGIIIVADFTLKILIMLSPIMIFTLLFDWIKPIFEKWLQLILNNTLTVLLVGLSFNILSNEYQTVIAQSLANSQNGSVGVLTITSDLFFTSLIILILILLSRGIARELTFVSIESIAAATGKQIASYAMKPTSYAARYARYIQNKRSQQA